jgi:3-methyladenine DNA glycosylase AlkD
LKEVSEKDRAAILQKFFKTGKGEYGEGDVFIGVTVPRIRKVVDEIGGDLSFDEIQKLLKSRIHEERLTGVLILVDRFLKSVEDKNRKFIFDFYLQNVSTGNVNNWDLVDLSAPKIVGNFLLHKRDRKILYTLAKSKNLWERRVAIVSTWSFIRERQFEDTIEISKILLNDKHDLIHKAIGWMLREVGKKDVEILRKFLRENYRKMPRTMLRYAIEKFDAEERKKWLEK